MDHQFEELTKAIEQTINIEHKKARIAVIELIETGVNSGDNPSTILANIIDWCGK